MFAGDEGQPGGDLADDADDLGVPQAAPHRHHDDARAAGEKKSLNFMLFVVQKVFLKKTETLELKQGFVLKSGPFCHLER